MQMQTPFELLKLRLEGEVGQWVEHGNDVLTIRQKVRDHIMSEFPNLYSWVTQVENCPLKVEIFDRSNGLTSLLELSFLSTKNRP